MSLTDGTLAGTDDVITESDGDRDGGYRGRRRRPFRPGTRIGVVALAVAGTLPRASSQARTARPAVPGPVAPRADAEQPVAGASSPSDSPSAPASASASASASPSPRRSTSPTPTVRPTTPAPPPPPS